MATGTDSDEKDLETLGEVTLNFFKAEPPTIQPFTSSKLSWSVTAPSGVAIRLDGAAVGTGGEQWVSASSTQAYRLSARAGRLSKELGVVAVHVDVGHCITYDTTLVPQLLIATLRDRINADTSGIYLRLVATQTAFGTTAYAPSTPAVWITADRLHIFLQLAKRVNDFPDPAVDISVSFGLQIVQDSITVFGAGRLAPVNEDISVDVSFPWYAWLIPGAMIALPIAIDEAKQNARAKAAEMITEIVGRSEPPHSNDKNLNNFFVAPPHTQKHNVQLYVDPDGRGTFAVTFCPRTGPVIVS